MNTIDAAFSVSRRWLAVPLLVALGAGVSSCGAAQRPASRSAENPPAAPREFRAAWVATVANIDWPSKKGLPVAQQQAEIVAILDRAADLHLNAIVLQVRPSADALYASDIEPWSEFLMGEQGKAPEPLYDPLKMWVEEAHRRGIELHAWFNPYRARHKDAESAPSPKHISQTKPNAVKAYGGYLWMDPGDPSAVEQSLNVILDVVRRYDVDGVHIDDYFYPYPVPAPAPPPETTPAATASPAAAANGALASTAPVPPPSTDALAPPPEPPELDFPDDPTWQAYLASGGTLARADWRRKNVSDFIERLYKGIHKEKSWVKYGISPFGLGRPDRRTPDMKGFSQYDKLYADVELWLQNGWLDYLAPQLYWPRDKVGQAFPTLLDYWMRENTKGRHVWPGLFTSKIDSTETSWQTAEVIGQIDLTRAKGTVRGQVHYSMISLLQNRKGIGDQLKSGPYAGAALVPATPWLDSTPPEPPQLDLQAVSDASGVGKVKAKLVAPPGKPATHYALWARYGSDWKFSVIPKAHPEIDLEAKTASGPLDRVVVSSVDRVGNESRPVRLSVSPRRM